MRNFPIPANEAERLKALQELGILDTAPEEDFDEIVRIASELVGVPITMISFLDHDRLWFKSKIGMDIDSAGRNVAFCTYTVAEGETLVIPDATLDERFADNPLVTGPENLRFYAGLPIKAEEGETLGTLCVFDRRPRELSAFQLNGLQVLRNQVERLLMLRKKIKEIEQKNQLLEEEIRYRQNLEKAYIKERNKAEDSSKAKELFLANMSHEIRTPLNAIIGLTNQVAKTELTHRQRYFMQNIQVASHNLLAIINDILDMTKINAGKLTVEFVDFNLNGVIRDVLKIASGKAKEKGLRFNLALDHKIADHMLGDPFRINQVLLNLLNNAIKFTDQGSVKLEARMLDENAGMQQIALVVSDTGIGMDQHFLRRIFQDFTQAESDTSRKYGGTGLGMSISKHLVELMHGKIEVDSEKGKGTTVTIKLPLKKVTAGQTVPELREETKEFKIVEPKRILLVEDNEMNRLVVAATLEAYDIEIVEAENGFQAISILESDKQFDLILMDLNMPVMDGFEAIAYLKNTMKSKIPVIALTANALRGEEQNCLAKGFDAYLAKPFEETEFLSLIGKFLNKSFEQNKEESSPAQESQLFDLNKLQAIGKGNQVFVTKMINIFIEQIPASIMEMEHALKNKDFEKIRKTAHKIKPALDTMGIQTLHGTIRQLEQVDPIPELCANLINQVSAVCNEVIAQLQTQA